LEYEKQTKVKFRKIIVQKSVYFRALNPAAMEELFFADLLGSTRIDSIIPQILKLDSLVTGLEA